MQLVCGNYPFSDNNWGQPCKVIFLSLWKTISTSIANFLGGNSELMGFIERWRCVFHTGHRVEAMMKQRQDEGSRQSNQGSYRSELRSLFRAWINEMKQTVSRNKRKRLDDAAGGENHPSKRKRARVSSKQDILSLMPLANRTWSRCVEKNLSHARDALHAAKRARKDGTKGAGRLDHDHAASLRNRHDHDWSPGDIAKAEEKLERQIGKHGNSLDATPRGRSMLDATRSGRDGVSKADLIKRLQELGKGEEIKAIEKARGNVVASLRKLLLDTVNGTESESAEIPRDMQAMKDKVQATAVAQVVT